MSSSGGCSTWRAIPTRTRCGSPGSTSAPASRSRSCAARQNLASGQLVPVARVGAVLPGGRRIERSKIRGVVSAGMLCSAAELGLGSDADGIHILGTGDEHPLGTELGAIVGETVLDVDVKPNRGDALSMIGLAREIAAFTGGEVRWPDISVSESTEATADHVTLAIDEPELCPRFAARWFSAGVATARRPTGCSAVSWPPACDRSAPIVDVTNYVMHELGQPQHAYDAAAIPGGRIVVRRAHDGEPLETLDHVARTLDPRMLVIADRDQAIGLAGIMGGAATEVGEGTTEVILESAVFHGPTIRNTARRLGLRSEASMRHEKGIGGELPRIAADRAAHLIAQITGARVGRGIVDSDPTEKPPRTVEVDVGRASRLLGIELRAERVAELLAPLGFVTTGTGATVAVTVPPHRLDVVGPEDVAEEIARAHGYGQHPGSSSDARAAAVPPRSVRLPPRGATHRGRSRPRRDGVARAGRAGGPPPDRLDPLDASTSSASPTRSATTTP